MRSHRYCMNCASCQTAPSGGRQYAYKAAASQNGLQSFSFTLKLFLDLDGKHHEVQERREGDDEILLCVLTMWFHVGYINTINVTVQIIIIFLCCTSLMCLIPAAGSDVVQW